MFQELWAYLNSHDFNVTVTWLTLYYSGAFFTALGLFMLMLGPRDRVERGFAWIIWAIVLVIVRSIAVRFYHRPTELWGSLVWLNLAGSITYTLWAMVRDEVIKRRARGLRIPPF